MKLSEAVRLVGMVNAYFPGKELAPETIQLWAAEVAPFELDDGLKAVRAIGTTAAFHPSLAEVLDAIRAEQRERIREQARALPPEAEGGTFVSLADYLASNPEAGKTWREFRRNWAKARGGDQ